MNPGPFAQIFHFIVGHELIFQGQITKNHSDVLIENGKILNSKSETGNPNLYFFGLFYIQVRESVLLFKGYFCESGS